ncbi:MAG: DUF362 domain-containing protein [Lachnospiraceae bacterium]|nr:DUF362 domain-containing protein [Lachnospiraceae bacterium]
MGSVAKIYFTRNITPESVVKLYEALGKQLSGRVAVKVHSGEEGNQNYLHPEFWKPMVEKVGGRVVECNTAYGGQRNTTIKHLELLKKHGWNAYFDVDLMDAEGPDVEIPVENGRHLQTDIVGKNFLNYDSMLVLSHFKGHPMGGFGGALKQLSIGCASSAGKVKIHSAGKYTEASDQDVLWSDLPEQDAFLESMAEAADAVYRHFDNNIVFINVMKNLSVDCDCCAIAEDPCMADVGILCGTDPVAIDKACLDLVKASNDPGKEHFLERVSSRHGEHTVEEACRRGTGVMEYELIDIDSI